MAPSHFVSDFEALFGHKPEQDSTVETKVVTAPETPAPESNTEAEVK